MLLHLQVKDKIIDLNQRGKKNLQCRKFLYIAHLKMHGLLLMVMCTTYLAFCIPILVAFNKFIELLGRKGNNSFVINIFKFLILIEEGHPFDDPEKKLKKFKIGKLKRE